MQQKDLNEWSVAVDQIFYFCKWKHDYDNILATNGYFWL